MQLSLKDTGLKRKGNVECTDEGLKGISVNIGTGGVTQDMIKEMSERGRTDI